ncbi:hypothetical protein V475_22280 [Sphingobium baderi LL03]|uniref:Uncharacterized protein n=1 Tax=Sphingobium baderi LL03 TaxID=1114964 RepID=T0I527_9SPHN|nr:hypothetical protein L485_03840 [Sphingobium baderi LL03]KMS51799.1 hypothetical protein V475_22280 [Sphingobium baderi LL03]
MLKRRPLLGRVKCIELSGHGTPFRELHSSAPMLHLSFRRNIMTKDFLIFPEE